jgi:hypothetical protein
VKVDLKVNPAPDADGFYPAGTMVRIGPVPASLDNGKYRLAGWAIDGKLNTTDKNSGFIELAMDDNHRVALIYELTK